MLTSDANDDLVWADSDAVDAGAAVLFAHYDLLAAEAAGGAWRHAEERPGREIEAQERRRVAAQRAYDRLVAEGAVEGVSTRGSGAPFRVSGDTYTRPMLREADEDVAGTMTVTFARGSDEVVSAEACFENAPAFGMR